MNLSPVIALYTDYNKNSHQQRVNTPASPLIYILRGIRQLSAYNLIEPVFLDTVNLDTLLYYGRILNFGTNPVNWPAGDQLTQVSGIIDVEAAPTPYTIVTSISNALIYKYNYPPYNPAEDTYFLYLPSNTYTLQNFYAYYTDLQSYEYPRGGDPNSFGSYAVTAIDLIAPKNLAEFTPEFLTAFRTKINSFLVPFGGPTISDCTVALVNTTDPVQTYFDGDPYIRLQFAHVNTIKVSFTAGSETIEAWFMPAYIPNMVKRTQNYSVKVTNSPQSLCSLKETAFTKISSFRKYTL